MYIKKHQKQRFAMDTLLFHTISKSFFTPEDCINNKPLIDTVDTWTSLSHSYLSMALEETLNVYFTTSETLIMTNYESIQSILATKTIGMK